LLIICQSFIFCFAIGKPLICFSLIVLEIIWFLFNYMLYRYGMEDSVKKHAKFIVAIVCISVAYFLLSLSAQINWVVIVIVVSLVVVVLIVYSIYQIVGLYYTLIFKDENKCYEEEMQPQIPIKLQNDK
jgi:hypothetical protein